MARKIGSGMAPLQWEWSFLLHGSKQHAIEKKRMSSLSPVQSLNALVRAVVTLAVAPQACWERRRKGAAHGQVQAR